MPAALSHTTLASLGGASTGRSASLASSRVRSQVQYLTDSVSAGILAGFAGLHEAQ